MLVKTLGDGAMLAFGSVRAALRTAVGIRDAATEDLGPPIRIGVNTGEALTQEDDYFGQTVNVAARIAPASPGEILVSQIVMNLVGQTDDFHFGDPRAVEFKGLPRVADGIFGRTFGGGDESLILRPLSGAGQRAFSVHVNP